MAAGSLPYLGQLDLPKKATPPQPSSGSARLCIGTDLILRWVDDNGDIYEAADKAILDDHINETDPYVHSAVKILSESSVGQGDVEADLSELNATKVESGAVTAITDVLDGRIDALDALLGGGDTYGDGPLTRKYYEDDFAFHSDTALTTGRIGETGWQYFESNAAGSIATTTASGFHPGMVRLSTGATSGVYVAIYKSAVGAGMFNGSIAFDLRFLVRTVNIDSNTQVRFGLTSDATSETPTDGIFAEKLTTDNTVWNNVKRVASVQTRAASAVALPTSNQHVQLRLRRIDATNVGFSYSTQAGAFSTEEVVAYSATTQISPFVSVKTGTTSSKSIDVDFWSLLVKDIVR